MSDGNKLLSIIIPLHNDVKYIRATIISCLDQGANVYVYDNASSDGSSDICAELASEYTNLRHIRHETNIGAFENMQKAVFECTTPFISFVGSHDLLTPGYSDSILSTMLNDEDLVLACGVIQHIDDEDNHRPNPTRAEWINETQGMPTLERVGVFVTKLRDCFLFYGIHRTETLRNVWKYPPMLGFDRLTIINMAAQGKIAYVPEATFLARDFIKTRNSKEDRSRRAATLGTSAVEKSNFTRNHEIAKTVLALATSDAELTTAFSILDALNKRLHNRRYYQRKRLAMVIGGIVILIGIVVLSLKCL